MAASTREVIATVTKQISSDPQLPRPNPTTSLWQVPVNRNVGTIQSTSLPELVDVAIIGSGIAACGVAKSLLSSSASGSQTVGIFEARTLCSGATGRNGGQLTRLPPTRHTIMKDIVGLEQATKIMKLTLKGLDEMHKLAEEQGPEFLKTSRRTRLEKFFAYYDETIWLESIEAIKLYESEVPEDKGAYKLISKEECNSKYGLNNTYGGLVFPAGVVSPYNLVTGTLNALLAKYPDRLTIETNTPVTAISFNSSNPSHPYLVQTPRGTVRAAQVVHCTNGFAGHLLPGLRGKMYPRRGTMSVQSPGKSFPDNRGKQSWSFNMTPEYDPRVGTVETGRYYGFQHMDTGDLWIGGDRDGIDGFITTDDTTIDRHADPNLRKILPKLFNENWIGKDSSVKGIWTGVMCYTGDQLPLVGKLPACATGRIGQGEWIAAGWNTYGMTNGLICSMNLGRMMLGEETDELFPEAYLPTEERLNGPYFKPDFVVTDYFKRVGADAVAEEAARSQNLAKL